MLELVEYKPTDHQWFASARRALESRGYQKVDILNALNQYTEDTTHDAFPVLRWYEKAKAESLTPRARSITNREIRRELVRDLIARNAGELPTYEQVEDHLMRQGIDSIGRQLLYKQISDIIGRKRKRSVKIQNQHLPPLFFSPASE